MRSLGLVLAEFAAVFEPTVTSRFGRIVEVSSMLATVPQSGEL
jgi:hypothetical protein